jgi:hypothetical protein
MSRSLFFSASKPFSTDSAIVASTLFKSKSFCHQTVELRANQLKECDLKLGNYLPSDGFNFDVIQDLKTLPLSR